MEMFPWLQPLMRPLLCYVCNLAIFISVPTVVLFLSNKLTSMGIELEKNNNNKMIFFFAKICPHVFGQRMKMKVCAVPRPQPVMAATTAVAAGL